MLHRADIRERNKSSDLFEWALQRLIYEWNQRFPIFWSGDNDVLYSNSPLESPDCLMIDISVPVRSSLCQGPGW